MITIILLALSLVVTAVILLASYRVKKTTKLILKEKENKPSNFYLVTRIVMVFYLLSFIVRIIYRDAFSKVVDLDMLFSPTIDAILVIVRALTMGTALVLIVVPFFNYRFLRNIVAFFGTLTYLADIILFTPNVQAILGIVKVPTYSFREIAFAAECVLGLSLSLSFLFQKIMDKDFKKIHLQLLVALGAFIGFSLVNMHPSSVENMFGTKWCGAALDFNEMHRGVVLLMLACTIVLSALFRKISNNNITHCFLAMASICAAIMFANDRNYADFHVWNLPLHLCNTGIILMLFSFTVKSKPIFYFNYLVNVVGALFAILLPDYDAAILSNEGIHYWHNHILLFMLPIIAVASGYYERPKLKYVFYSTIVFAIYFIIAASLDAWFVNYDKGINYFFLNGDTIINRFRWSPPIKYNYIIEFNINELNFKIYWLYWLLTFIVYVGFIFVAWYGYFALYQISDGYFQLAEENRIQNQKILKLKKELNGRSFREPLYKDDGESIRIKNFSKIYEGSERKAVDNFSLEVKGGEVFGFVGHNGAGKSTTIKSIVGIQTITEGTMSVCGYDVESQSKEAKTHIGYVSDNHAVYEALTGREYVNYVADLYDVSQQDRDEIIEKYVTLFDLNDAFDREIKGYSHGMKQKLVVISSLVHNPDVWVLDEPLTGLDPTSSIKIKECMKEHANRGNIVFFSSHAIEVVEKICDRIAIIDHGKLIGVWRLEDLYNSNQSLEDLYLKVVPKVHKEGDDNAS